MGPGVPPQRNDPFSLAGIPKNVPFSTYHLPFLFFFFRNQSPMSAVTPANFERQEPFTELRIPLPLIMTSVTSGPCLSGKMREKNVEGMLPIGTSCADRDCSTRTRCFGRILTKLSITNHFGIVIVEYAVLFLDCLLAVTSFELVGRRRHKLKEAHTLSNGRRVTLMLIKLAFPRAPIT